MLATILRNGAFLALVVTGVAACAADGASGDPTDPENAPVSPTDVAGKADQELSPVYAPLPEGASLDAPFCALFAPDDPVVTLEVALIDRGRGARRTDPAAYDDGANPYRIRYAVYNLRNPSVIDRLALAHGEGVDVQILIESEQLDPARDWNTADEQLVAHGFELGMDHRRLDARSRATADLVGIVGSGLMHLKTRIFETPSEQLLLTGSMNPGDEAADNDETLHLVRDSALITRYAAAFESVRDGVGLTNVYDESRAVNVLFAPERDGPRAATQMLRWIEEENELIFLMVFSLRDVSAPGATRSLVALLEAKARAGVPVCLVTDRKQSDGIDAAGNHIAADDRTEDRLRAAGVHVYEVLNESTPFTAMHHKVAILGLGRRVITDAANWSAAGLGTRNAAARNVESMLFVDSTRLDGGLTGRRYLAQALRVLARYEGQLQQDGEPSLDATVARLTALSGWPSQAVSFVADPVETRWGESVFVRGDQAALGDWGSSHAGVVLSTDAERYPRWSGIASPGPRVAPERDRLASLEHRLPARRSGRGEHRNGGGRGRHARLSDKTRARSRGASDRRVLEDAEGIDNGMQCFDDASTSAATGVPRLGTGDDFSIAFSPANPNVGFLLGFTVVARTGNARASDCRDVRWTNSFEMGEISLAGGQWSRAMLAAHPTDINAFYTVGEQRIIRGRYQPGRRCPPEHLVPLEPGCERITFEQSASDPAPGHDTTSIFVERRGFAASRTRIIVGTADAGVHVSLDEGDSWSPWGSITPPPALMFTIERGGTPREPLYYLATTSGLFFGNPDRGIEWKRAPTAERYVVSDVEVDPTEPCRVYVALGYGAGRAAHRGGILLSTDYGESFPQTITGAQNIGLHQGPVTDVEVDPERPEYLYAASYGHGFWFYDWSASGALPSCSP